ncbi:MAG TPA: retropepsin-like aspartic protease [Blastocatellia bacterium]|nr:retropepsin-like aspartic protease [Blastocatellia bacterium]HMV84358.1 retropepsin-like aspartic protease [Blastocatellia bacterium]HMY72390.1 retropepsin-like aspartic protease [Blastocatellia bacterium]HMZ18307.1 retropepsin-like aspartic protease [Blastocatellia bacterium]HNG30653.1 retropepsin-like aspartic protease [Blastocatellia bacterium]
MSWNFSFSNRVQIREDAAGLCASATLSVAGAQIQVDGYLDVGAAYCVIPRDAGERLGLDVEAGEATNLRTGMGPIQGYLHYAVLTVGDLVFEDVPVFVAKYPGFDRCLLGRAGWLQRVRMNLVTYDNFLYLDLHGQ